MKSNFWNNKHNLRNKEGFKEHGEIQLFYRIRLLIPAAQAFLSIGRCSRDVVMKVAAAVVLSSQADVEHPRLAWSTQTSNHLASGHYYPTATTGIKGIWNSTSDSEEWRTPVQTIYPRTGSDKCSMYPLSVMYTCCVF